jgi:hypothetical protein
MKNFTWVPKIDARYTDTSLPLALTLCETFNMSGVSSQWLIDITSGIKFSWINSSLSEPGSLFKVPMS